MKAIDIWHLSTITYDEVAFRSNKESSGGVASLGDGNLDKRFKMIFRSAKISKTAFAFFGTIGAGIPFLDFLVYPGPESLISAISLSLAISLAYVVFYSLQVLPSFANSEAFSVLHALPLRQREFSLVAVFALIRTFDYLVVGTSLLQVTTIWLLTHSIVASLLMIVGALVNAVFAAAIALWFSQLFYHKVTHSTGKSKTAAIGRLLFLIGWGFAAMSIGFLFNLISYLLPFLNNTIGSSFATPSSAALSLIHPFSISLAIAVVIYPSLLPSISFASIQSFVLLFYILAPFLSSILYVSLAFFAGKRTYLAVSKVALLKDSASSKPRTSSRDYNLNVRSILLAQIVKDLRLASKNPSMAFLYALPVFVVFMMAVITAQFPVLHASAIIVSTVIGSSFTIMICTTLLNTEGVALEYSFSLPIKVREIVESKTLVATLMFTPVPLALVVLGFAKELTSYYLLLIPIVEVIVIYAACMSEIMLFFGSGRSRGFSTVAGAGIGRLVLSLATALIVFMMPLGAYSIQFVLTANHIVSILTMLLFASGELTIVLGINRRIFKH